ncbi:MAG: PstS family phosphate ABC transporter substrate-binding protein [Candidatus Hydrogenedentota bacterium]
MLHKLMLRGMAIAGAMMVAALLSSGTASAAEDVVMDGSTTVGPIAKAFAEYYMENNPDVNITVSESGSGNGAKSLINSTCDIANMSRFMKGSEFTAAVEAGVTPVAHIVALDGIAVIVHPSNPLKEITLAQLKDVYQGKIKNWSQLGGPNVKIVAISRDTNSGTYETFEGIVMQKEKMAEGIEYVGSNGAVRSRVQSTQAAIGYVGVGFLDRSVKGLAVEGIMPSTETVKTGEYAISRPLFMLTNGVPKMGSTLWKFVNLYLSRKGQEIVEEIGFVPVTNY